MSDIKINVKHVAKLASLNLPDEKLEKFEKQLKEILGYVDILSKADTKDVATTAQVTGLENVTRDDKSTPSLSQDEALSGTKAKHNGLFKVNAILENE